MTTDLIKQSYLFEKYTQGHLEALISLYELEKFSIFDFILRMTGNKENSLKTLEHLNEILNTSKYKWQTLSELRVSLYLKAKKLNEKNWGTDTSHIINPLLQEEISKKQESKDSKLSKYKAYINLEKSIGSCASIGREILLLHVRSRFSFSEIQDFNNLSHKEVEEFFFIAIDFLKKKEPNLPRNPKKVITMIHEHPFKKDENIFEKLWNKIPS